MTSATTFSIEIFILSRDLALQNGASINLGLEVRDELLHGTRAEIALGAMPHADRARLGFSSSEDEHVGDFLQLGVANFRLQLLVAVVEMDAEAGVLQLLGDFIRVLRGLLAER